LKHDPHQPTINLWVYRLRRSPDGKHILAVVVKFGVMATAFMRVEAPTLRIALRRQKVLSLLKLMNFDATLLGRANPGALRRFIRL
jgi:hypothetical protein